MIHNPRTPKSAPLVGMHFRPPAKALIQSLSSGYPLELRPEPSNPYDPNAVAVWLDARFLNDDAIDELTSTLPGTGHDIEELLATRWWQLGYMAREHAALHQRDIAQIIIGHNEDADVSGEGFIWNGYPATLTFTGDGKPLVTFNI
jgi:hypothetical protein